MVSNLNVAPLGSPGEADTAQITPELAGIKEAWEQMVVKGLTPSHPIRVCVHSPGFRVA